MHIEPLGDSALLVRLADAAAESERALITVRDLVQRIEALSLPAVVDVVPAT